MIRIKLPTADTIAVTTPFRLVETDRSEPPTERKPASDGVFRADAIDTFLQFSSGRAEAIYATVAVFRRYPKLRVFYVEKAAAGCSEPGWYSQVKSGANAGNGHPPLTLGPFSSHLEAQNAWLGR